MQGLQSLAQIHGEKCWPLVVKRAPCEEACPLGTDVPSYVIAIARGKFKEALEVIREVNPFPSVCGRVCTHPCEEACNRVLVDEPIAVSWLKRVVADRALASGERPTPAPRTREEMVAIIGSGPAGLTAAYDLVKQGYAVTVYEALPVAGGMMAAGIPEYRLPRRVLNAEIDYIRALGVDIRTNTPIGKELTLDDLFRKGYKAVFIAVGAHRSQMLGIPGEDAEGVVHGVDFLRALNLGREVKVGERVGIIGGGNVAMDAARAAKRLGAKEVTILYRRSRDEMPASDEEVEAAQAEGIKVEYLVAPSEVLVSKGKVAGLKLMRMRLGAPDASGRPQPIPISGSEFEIKLDTVMPAIGQAADLSFLGEGSSISSTKENTLSVDEETLATSRPGVFAGGDAVTGPASVVKAIAAGHRAAESIARYLQGHDLKEGRGAAAVEVFKIEERMVPHFLVRKERWEMPAIWPQDAVRTFCEVNLGYPEWEAVEEARRCLNCRMCGNCIFGRGQICLETGSRLL